MAGILLVTPLGGCSKDTKKTSVETNISQKELYKVFNPGEHILSIRIEEDLRKKFININIMKDIRLLV